MAKNKTEESIVRQLLPLNLSHLDSHSLRREIQIAIMEYEDLNPDSISLISRIEVALRGILARVKYCVPVSDIDLADITGKSRATVQAYIGGRLDEVLSIEDLDKLKTLVEGQRPIIDRLLADIERQKQRISGQVKR